MAAIYNIQEQNFTPHNIQQSFRKTGIWPLNPERIITIIRAEYSARDPIEVWLSIDRQSDDLNDEVDRMITAVDSEEINLVALRRLH